MDNKLIVLLIIGAYFLIINLLGFFIMGIDKRRARNKNWRISEASLFTVAFFGGVIGCLIGMFTFHHKTQKPLFFIGMPAILGVYLIILIILFIFKPVLFGIM